MDEMSKFPYLGLGFRNRTQVNSPTIIIFVRKMLNIIVVFNAKMVSTSSNTLNTSGLYYVNI
jgi:hypothetical protein